LESCNYKRRNNETIVNIENTSKNNSFDAIDSLCFVFKNGKPEDTTRTNNLKKLYGIYIDNKTSLANQNRIETVFIGQSYYYTNSSVSAFDYWIYSQKSTDCFKYNGLIVDNKNMPTTNNIIPKIKDY
jgi:hypothetical protein